MRPSPQNGISEDVREAFAPVMKALDRARQDLAARPDIVAVRPGYKYTQTGAPEPALVVATVPGEPLADTSALEKIYGAPVVGGEATLEEQLVKRAATPSVTFKTLGRPAAPSLERLITGEAAPAFLLPKKGSYEPPVPPNLPLVKERMRLAICVSPEAGWAALEDFLAATRERLTVAMYQFTAPHIFAAVKAAVEPEGRKFELVLHPVPEKPPASGVKAQDLDEETEVVDPLEEDLQKRFTLAWATLTSKAHPQGLWASAYHIKVAVRDGTAVWLSSGNWQSSNQPKVRLFDPGAEPPPPGFQRNYNRDYHAVIESKALASIFEGYIRRDRLLSAEQAIAPAPFAAPDLFVPKEGPQAEAATAPKFFKPLQIDRVLSAQPLLTPDNYVEHALALIRSAKESIRFQNQYINFKGTDEDFPEFQSLIGALKEKMDAGVDVRIICRDLMKQESLDVLVALGFPADKFRFQPACHNKTIIVDGKVAMFGSHNWSNEGVKTNRDASILFDDAEIAQYLAEIYDYDWTRLATAHPATRQPRIAMAGEPTPAGFRRASYAEIFDD